MADVRLALRALLKNPLHAAIAVLTLAVAVGGATAIFSVLNAVVLRPLPYPQSDRLALIRDANPPRFPEFSVSPGRFLEWRTRGHFFESVAAVQTSSMNLTGSGDPMRLRVSRISPNMLDVLRVQPATGHGFEMADETPGHDAKLLLSDGLWRSRFGADPAIVGKTLLLDDKAIEIVGVMPAGFAFPNTTTVAWTPLSLTDAEHHRYGSHYLSVVARLKDGATFDAARADLARAAREIEPLDSGNTGWTTILWSYHDYLIRDVRAGVWLLSGAVVVLLLIACANVANLLLAKGLARRRELGVRAALGATRTRLVRQMLVENFVLGTLAAILGLVFAELILRAVAASPATGLPRAQSIGLDTATLICAVVLAGLTPLIFGLLPALQASRTDLRDLVSQGGRSGASTLRNRTRATLIVAEVALAVMLVAGSTLLMRSFAHVMDVPPGFESDRQLAVSVSLPETKYATDDQRTAFWSALLDRVRSVPMIEAVGLTQSVPLQNDMVSSFEIPDKTPTDITKQPPANFYAVTPGYFKTMGIPILRGRDIADTDIAAAPRIAIISKTLAERYFGNADPIGQRLRIHQGPQDVFAEIVGVVGDIKQYGLETATTLQVYQPARQHAYLSTFTLIVRTTSAPSAVTSSIRQVLKEVDPALPIANAITIASLVDTSVGPKRLTTVLLAGFASVALLLAVIGVYGLVSFTVGQRTQEIGLRMALGAQRSSVLGLVFRQGLGLTAIGAVLGALTGLAGARWLDSLLFNVSARDPLAFLGAPLCLLAAAAIACYWPARRALNVSPSIALRQP